jgi:phytoene dehydrogenase-like protein
MNCFFCPDRLGGALRDRAFFFSKGVRTIGAGIRTFTHFDLSILQQQPKELMSLGDWGRLTRKMLPFLCPLSRWGNLSAAEFANRFQDPFLRRAIPQMFSWDSIPVMVGMSLLAYMHTKNAGFPLGGSLQFSEKIASRYLALGGKIHYDSQVEKILIENDKAIGVRLYNNEKYRSYRVISACDGHNTLFSLLDRQYVPREIQRYYDGHLPIHAQLQVSLGVNRDLSAAPHWVTHLLDEPIVIAGEKRYEIGVKHYCFDPSLAPLGKSVLIVMMTTNYEYWQRIYGRSRSVSERESIYNAEEMQESQILTDVLERFYPGVKDDIEFIDVATPLTYERYTGNWQGATCGWLLTKKTLPLSIKGVPKIFPKLRNFYAIGQWVEPGGSVPVVAMSGRNIIQQICREDKQSFSPV